MQFWCDGGVCNYLTAAIYVEILLCRESSMAKVNSLINNEGGDLTRYRQ
jgi:hypothetical protein